MSMSLSPTTSGGSPALIEVASDVVSSLIEVRVSLTFRLLCETLNSSVSFWARVLDTLRAQNCTVPVALVPKLADPGPEADDDAAGLEPEDEQPAAAAATRAVAEKSAKVLVLFFMCRFLQD